MINPLFANSELADLLAKVDSGKRLDFADGVRLFKSNELLAIGYMADLVRRRKHGSKAFFLNNKPQGLNVATDAILQYGQEESIEARVEKLLQLRELQDKNGTYLALAPVGAGGLTGFEDLKVLAVARLLLDNFDHIRVSLQIGLKLAQVALSFGVDDLEVLVVESGIDDAAGAESGMAMTKASLLQMLQAAGRQPVARDTLYNTIEEF